MVEHSVVPKVAAVNPLSPRERSTLPGRTLWPFGITADRPIKVVAAQGFSPNARSRRRPPRAREFRRLISRVEPATNAVDRLSCHSPAWPTTNGGDRPATGRIPATDRDALDASGDATTEKVSQPTAFPPGTPKNPSPVTRRQMRSARKGTPPTDHSRVVRHAANGVVATAPGLPRADRSGCLRENDHNRSRPRGPAGKIDEDPVTLRWR